MSHEKALAGVRVVIDAGPTYEDIDPVRFLGNRSSGKMGFAIAEACAAEGADVTLIAGPVALATPAGVARRVDVRSALQMRDAVKIGRASCRERGWREVGDGGVEERGG